MTALRPVNLIEAIEYFIFGWAESWKTNRIYIQSVAQVIVQLISYKKRWTILAVGCYMNMFVYATLFTFASLLNDMLDKFRENISRTTAVQTIFSGVGLSTGTFTGILISKFGMMRISLIGAIMASVAFILSFLATSIVHLYICIGLIAGIGSSFMTVSSVTAVRDTFSGSQRLLALAIQNTCVSVGGAITPYLFDYCVKNYGLNGTFLLMSGIYLNGIPAAYLFSTHQKNNLTSTNNTSEAPTAKMSVVVFELNRLKTTILKIVRPTFIFTVMANAIVMASLAGVNALIVEILQWRGFTSEQALLAFPALHVLGIVARILPGIAKQIRGINSFVFPIIFCLCGACGQLALIFTTNRVFILMGCALLGISMAGVMSGTNIVAVKLLHQDDAVIGFGIIYSSIGLLTIMYGPAYGVIKDTFQTYDVVLYLSVAFQLLGVAFLVIAIYKRKYQTQENSNTLKGLDNFTLTVDE